MAVANAGWMTGARLLNDALSLVLFGIIAREYGPAGLGVYSTYFAIATILYDLVSLGVDDYGVREYAVTSAAERPSLLQKLLRLQLLTALVCVGGLFLFCAVANLRQEEVQILASLTTFQLCNALARTMSVPGLVQGSIAGLTISNVSSRLGVALLALVMAEYFDASLALCLLGYPIFGITHLAVVMWLERRHLPARGLFVWSGHEWGMLKALSPFALSQALHNFVIRVPMFVLFFMVSDVAAGLYSTAYKLMDLGRAAVLYFILASYAALTRAAARGLDALASVADLLLRQVLVIAGVLAWGLHSVAPWLLVPLLGAKVAEAQPLLQAIAPYLLLFCFSLYIDRMMYVLRMQVLTFRTQVLKAALTVLFCVLAAPRFGVPGTIVALTVAEAIVLSIRYTLVARRLPASFLRRVPALFIAVVALAVMSDVLLRSLVHVTPLGDALALVVLLCGCVATGILSRRVVGNLSHSR